MLPVFGVLPRSASTTTSLTQLEHAREVDTAMDSASSEQERRRVAFGLRHSGGPKSGEDQHGLHDLPFGTKVLVYRTVSKRWEGP